MPLSTVTITGTWLTPSNVPASGTVTIQPVQEVSGGGFIVADVPVTANLNASGAISATVVSNAQASNLQYQITEQITGAPAVSYVISPVGSSIDLSTVYRGSVTPLPAFGAGKATGSFTGSGSTTSFPVTHNLGNSAPVWFVYVGAQQYQPEFQPSSPNAGSFVFSSAPGNGVVYQYTLIG